VCTLTGSADEVEIGDVDLSEPPVQALRRPMDLVDDIAVHELSVKTFEELEERMGVPLSPPPRIGTRCCASAISSARTPAVDPGARRRVIGAALASVREGRW
jgi:hypothetical protein